MKVILTRAELIQLARTSSTISRAVDNSDWEIYSFTTDDVVIERFTKMFPEYKYDVSSGSYVAEIREDKYISILKIVDSNVVDLVRIAKGIWMMIEGLSGSLKRIGKEIESIVKH